jgi:gas vesicle protein
MIAPYDAYGSSGAMRGDDPEAIRAGISQTRERISQDLDQLGERLNPHNIKADIKEGIREATIGRVEEMARQAADRLNNASSGFAQTIRENPLPAAMAGIGLAWLIMSNGKSSHSASYGQYQERGRLDTAKEKVSEFAEQAQEKVSDIAGQAQETVSSAATPRVEGLRNSFEESPLTLAAGVIALGLVAGMLTPVTRREARLMGDVGEKVVDKVSEVARETSEKAQHVAQRAIEETKNAAREEGLAPTSGQQGSMQQGSI